MDIEYAPCSKPKICRKCGSEFSNWAVVDGKRISLSARRYCLTCSPYRAGRGRGNKARLENYKKIDGVEHKRCIDCRKFLLDDHFYGYTNARGQPQSSSRCKTCTSNHYVGIKEEAVAYKGGKCEDCQLVFRYWVFDFHHLDPTQKDMNVMANHPKSLNAIKEELDKCVLLCSNCHRDRHYNPENPHHSPIRLSSASQVEYE